MGQEVGDLIHQIQAQFVVVDADMHMHAADHQPPDNRLQVLGDDLIAFSLGRALFLPAGKRVGRGGNGGEAVFIGDLGNDCAHLFQVYPGIGDSRADLGVDLDLGLEKFMRYQAFDLGLAGLEQGFRRVAGDIPGNLVDKQVFFFDTDGEGRFC